MSRYGEQAERSRMVVMPSNATGWFWHALARETGRIGHLYSPDAQRGPWPWMPYALDNGAFSAWNQGTNTWDEARWSEAAWRRLLIWSTTAPQPARWAIVPDVPGDAERTLQRWVTYAPDVVRAGVPTALAVQDGMTPADVERLAIPPDVIAVGGSTGWKWATIETWARAFPRVHLLRCNAPDRLPELDALGVESCDGTGWSRGDRRQTSGLEQWCRANAEPLTRLPLWPHVCREPRQRAQLRFA